MPGLPFGAVRPPVPTLPPLEVLELERNQVLGEELFKDALIRERKRADRFDYAFVMLVVDLGRHSLEPAVWTPLLRALTFAKEDADIIGWLERGTVVGLLAPEAAEETLLRLTDRVRCAIATRLGEYALATLSIRCYGHGGKGGSDIQPVDRVIEAFIGHRSKWDCWDDAAKRGLDIVGSVMLLACCAPLFALIAAAVKWTSPGPVLFRQTRVGRRGAPFTMLKFRSMRTDIDDAIHHDYVTWFITSSDKQARKGDEVFKITSDPRVTRVGHFLRKTSLDELPQFWNVLRGAMSLVGPRPPLPFEVEQYQPWHRRRVLDAAPGITGLWQVTGRSSTTFDEMVRLDLRYAMTRSLWTDLWILAATPRAVISGKGAC